MLFLTKLFDCIKLYFLPFPDKSLKGKVKICFIYVYLAIKNKNIRRIEFPKVMKSRNTWGQFVPWMRFQLMYINEIAWLDVPLIKIVAGGYTSKINHIDSLSDSIKTKLLNSAKIYTKISNHYTLMNFANWFAATYKLITYLKVDFFSSLNTKALVEIGPGIFNVKAISDSILKKAYYSYDTFEMQEIQKYIEKINNNSGCIYYSTNLAQKDNHIIPVPDKKYDLIAMWSLTELDINERKMFINLISNSETAIIACNERFGKVNNFEYLENLTTSLNKTSNFEELGVILKDKVPGYANKHRVYIIK